MNGLRFAIVQINHVPSLSHEYWLVWLKLTIVDDIFRPDQNSDVSNGLKKAVFTLTNARSLLQCQYIIGFIAFRWWWFVSPLLGLGLTAGPSAGATGSCSIGRRWQSSSWFHSGNDWVPAWGDTSAFFPIHLHSIFLVITHSKPLCTSHN